MEIRQISNRPPGATAGKSREENYFEAVKFWASFVIRNKLEKSERGTKQIILENGNHHQNTFVIRNIGKQSRIFLDIDLQFLYSFRVSTARLLGKRGLSLGILLTLPPAFDVLQREAQGS
jgi:hypothetical protein